MVCRALPWRGVPWWCVVRRLGGTGCGGAWPPACWSCCVRAWPPSCWGVLCWCVAPRLVKHVVVVPGPPRGGACCGGAWPASWWGVLLNVRRGLQHGGACCVCAGVSVFVRWFGFGCGSPVAWPGQAGQLPECVRCAIPFSWRDRRASIPRTCGAPPRVVLLRVSSPRRSFSLVRPPLPCRPLYLPPPLLRLCFAAVVGAPLFFPLPLRACWLLQLAARGPLMPPTVHLTPAPPSAGPGFVGACALPLVFACPHSALSLLRAVLLSPGGSGFLLPTCLLVGCFARVLLLCCLFFLVCFVLNVCCHAPSALSAVVAASPSP